MYRSLRSLTSPPYGPRTGSFPRRQCPRWCIAEAKDHRDEGTHDNQVESQEAGGRRVILGVNLEDEKRVVEEEEAHEEGADPALHVTPVLPRNVAHLHKVTLEQTVAERQRGEHHKQCDDLKGDLPPHGPSGKVSVNVHHVGLGIDRARGENICLLEVVVWG